MYATYALIILFRAWRPRCTLWQSFTHLLGTNTAFLVGETPSCVRVARHSSQSNLSCRLPCSHATRKSVKILPFNHW